MKKYILLDENCADVAYIFAIDGLCSAHFAADGVAADTHSPHLADMGNTASVEFKGLCEVGWLLLRGVCCYM